MKGRSIALAIVVITGCAQGYRGTVGPGGAPDGSAPRPDAGAPWPSGDASTPAPREDAGAPRPDAAPPRPDASAPRADAGDADAACGVETCNGLDDDCDGARDDGFACILDTIPVACTTACGTAGSTACTGSCERTACAAALETCGNGCDDDGNGLVDDACVDYDSCGSARDVSSGGTFTFDTCGATETVSTTCGRAGTPDVVIAGDAPISGSTYRVTVPDGWVIMQVDGTCAPMPLSCGLGGYGVSGASIDRRWYWAIEKADGGCDVVDVAVERTM